MVTHSASLKLLKIVSILIQPKFSLLFQIRGQLVIAFKILILVPLSLPLP